MKNDIIKKTVRIEDAKSINSNKIQIIADDNPDFVSQFTYRDIIFELIHIEMDEQTAKKHWIQLMKHLDYLNTKLERKVGIIMASIDYFHNFQNILINPAIFEAALIEDITKISVKDSLTTLYTKGVFSILLKEQEEEYRNTKEVFSIILMGLDNFKLINGKFGYLQGDLVLRKIGELIKANLSSNDIASRYTGEEFIILLPRTNKTKASLFAEELRKRVFESFKKKEYKVSVSIGIEEMKNSYDSKEVIDFAHKAMLVSKAKGKNTVTVYSDNM